MLLPVSLWTQRFITKTQYVCTLCLCKILNLASFSIRITVHRFFSLKALTNRYCVSIACISILHRSKSFFTLNFSMSNFMDPIFLIESRSWLRFPRMTPICYEMSQLSIQPDEFKHATNDMHIRNYQAIKNTKHTRIKRFSHKGLHPRDNQNTLETVDPRVSPMSHFVHSFFFFLFDIRSYTRSYLVFDLNRFLWVIIFKI